MLAGLFLFFLVSPLPQEGGAASNGKDAVFLRSGGFVDGVIVSESDATIVVEIAPGARIEVSRADVAEVKRAQRKTAEEPAASRPVTVPATHNSESWYLIRNAHGQTVGVRELRVTTDSNDPSITRIEEITTIHDDGNKNVRVHRIETADRDLRPIDCHYRETSEGNSSTVEARLADGKLVVETLDDQGRLRFEIPQIGKLTFPLIFREKAKKSRLSEGESLEAEVFDPFARTIVKRGVRGLATQSIALGDETPSVHSVFVALARGVENLVWLRASGDVAREELNGPDLVATVCAEEVARRAMAPGTAPVWSFADGSGRIRVLLPSEDWQLERSTADAVALARKNGTASFVACGLDIESDVTTTGAALLLERRLAHSMPRYQRNGTYETLSLGSQSAIKFEFQSEGPKGSRGGFAVAIRGKKGAAACVMTFDGLERQSAERELNRLLQRGDFQF